MLRLKVQLTLVLIAAMVCQPEAWWSSRRRTTSTSVCSNPPTGFGAMQTGCSWPYAEGETCGLECRDGYRRTSGDTSRVCNGGTWSGETLVCEYTGCGRIPYTRAWRTGCYWPYDNGETCTFYCREGYIETGGDTSITCNNGTWSGTPLACEYTGCQEPTFTGFEVSRQDCWWPYANGEICNYSCRDGYTGVSGDSSITCNNGTWSGIPLTCDYTGCERPPSTSSGSWSKDCRRPYVNGKNCTYSCWNGYTEVSGDTSITCNNGTWSGTPLACEYTGCERPPDTTGSRGKDCLYPYVNGKNCTYTCRDVHYAVSGNSSIICVDGAWSGTPLECRPGCDPPLRRFGFWGPSNCHYPYEEGETCTFSCRRGFEQESGDTSTTCIGGQWTGEPLVCTRTGGGWFWGRR